MFFSICPRCGEKCLEKLRNHAHCFHCNYFPEDDSINNWRDIEYHQLKIPSQRRKEEDRILYGSTYKTEVMEDRL